MDIHFPDVSRFAAVDEVEDPQRLIDILDMAKRLPGFAAAKAQMLEQLMPAGASSALDVGCGHGADVLELARRVKAGGRAIGLDVSESMVAEARRRSVDSGLDVAFVVGDAVALPFDDAAFDICRIETVLQHLAAPPRAVAEMARVTRSGGRIAALELDPATMYVDHADIGLFECLKRSFVSAVPGSLGRQVPRLFVEAGLTDVHSTPHVITGNPHAFRVQLAHHVDELRDLGAITAERARRWWSAIDAAAAAGHFMGGVTAFVVWGTVS